MTSTGGVGTVTPPITSLWGEALTFRLWLASLPQDRPIRCWSAQREPFIYWLRKVSGDLKARLVRCGDEGYQDYLCHGVRDEVPGTYFWSYDLYERRDMTAAEYIAAWDASLAEDGYDQRSEYWDALGMDAAAVERMARR